MLTHRICRKMFYWNADVLLECCYYNVLDLEFNQLSKADFKYQINHFWLPFVSIQIECLKIDQNLVAAVG